MRKINNPLVFVLLALLLLLTSCDDVKLSDAQQEGLLNIKKPEIDNEINGKWKLMTTHKLPVKANGTPNNNSEAKINNEIFITNSVFEYKETKIIDPIVTARYLNINNYMKSKGLELPETLKVKDENVVVYKFQDQKILSQDVLEISNGRLLIFQKNEVEVYERYTTVSKKEEESHYASLKNAIEGTDKSPSKMEYAITLGVRKEGLDDKNSTFNYDYETYFILKEQESINPRVLLVRDIVYSKDSVLWTVSHDRSYTDGASPLIVDKISANPTFRDKDAKVNFIQETIARKIDYVNDNYLALSNINQLTKNSPEYYEIHNINQLAKNKPLTVTNIGGPQALESFNNAYSDTVNSVASQTETPISYKADETNIGIDRDRMSWLFKSKFQARVAVTDRIIYRNMTLQILPILDIATNDNKSIAWKDVLNRVPFATNAIVAPDGKTIVIQSSNQISVFSIYNNFISLNPQVVISNVINADIIMSKWYGSDALKPLYEDFLKLPRGNVNVAY